jgi:NADP-dependent 3-hydroxy acid dehydrogenase YdfG
MKSKTALVTRASSGFGERRGAQAGKRRFAILTLVLASIDRVEKIAGNRKARVVVQHDPADFKSLPKFPAYLQ